MDECVCVRERESVLNPHDGFYYRDFVSVWQWFFVEMWLVIITMSYTVINIDEVILDVITNLLPLSGLFIDCCCTNISVIVMATKHTSKQG